MSIVINGTTNTITAGSGVTLAGALTLGGTVSGGGNQINNVVIGASTPLAGSFTTLSATGASAADYLISSVRNSDTGAGSATQTRVYGDSTSNFLATTVTSVARSSAYLTGGPTTTAAHIWTGTNIPISIGVNTTEVGRFSSTGLAVTGTLSATGNVSIGGASTSTFLTVGRSTATENKDTFLQARAYTGNEFSTLYSAAVSGGNVLYIGGGTVAGEPATAVNTFIGTAGSKATGSLVTAVSATGLAVTGTLSSATGSSTRAFLTTITDSTAYTTTSVDNTVASIQNLYGSAANTCALLSFNCNNYSSTWVIGAAENGGGAYTGDFIFKRRTGASTYVESAKLTSTGLAVTGTLNATDHVTLSDTKQLRWLAGDALISATTAGSFLIQTSGATTNGNIVINAKTNLIGQVNSSAVTTTSSTGLAVTGTLSATGALTCGAITESSTSASTFTRTSMDGIGIATVFQLATDAKTINDGVKLNFTSLDSGLASQVYGSIRSIIVDPTAASEDGTLVLAVAVAGTETDRLTINAAGATVTGAISSSGDLKFTAAAKGIYNTSTDTYTFMVADGSSYAGVLAYGTTHATKANHLELKASNAVIGTLTSTGLAVTGLISATTTGKVGTTLGVGGATPAASGAGITFPAAASASTDVNTLDDYEEGVWTPSVTFATPGDVSVAYTTQAGTYIKVGRKVTVNFYIATSSFTHTTAASYLTISGLPFASSATITDLGFGSMEFQGITKASYTQFTPYAQQNSTLLYVGASGSGQNQSVVVAGDVPTGGVKIFIGSVTYFAAN